MTSDLPAATLVFILSFPLRLGSKKQSAVCCVLPSARRTWETSSGQTRCAGGTHSAWYDSLWWPGEWTGKMKWAAHSQQDMIITRSSKRQSALYPNMFFLYEHVSGLWVLLFFLCFLKHHFSNKFWTYKSNCAPVFLDCSFGLFTQMFSFFSSPGW